MKTLTEYLWLEVPGRRGFINITAKIEELVQRSGVREGLCLVNAMHITASVFINDDESGLHHDYEIWLEKLVPRAPVSAYGFSFQLSVFQLFLPFFYGEFDGRRRKRALVKIIGE